MRKITQRSLGKSALGRSPRWLYAKRIGCLCAPLLACEPVQDEFEELGASSTAQALTASVSFQQGVNGYSGTTDAHLLQVTTSGNTQSSTTCETDGDDGSGVDKSCLIRWDVSQIPAGASVLSASLGFRITDGTANTYQLYAVKRAWSEAQATWSAASTGVAWQTAGALGAADRGAVVGTLTGSGARSVTLNADGIALVQAWVNGGLNAGILLANASNTDGLDVASSEHSTVSYRPKLTVTYTTSESGSGGSGGGGSTGAGSASSGGATTSGGTATSGGVAGATSGGTAGAAGSTATDENLLIAFIGDQGANGNSDAVLRLIKAEGAAATIHNGDFDYVSNPSAWNTRINGILGANYPYFSIVGNHDAAAWGGSNGYASFINARHARVPSMQCSGDLGVKASCRFRGLHLIQSCVGVSELSGHGNCNKDSSEQTTFLTNSLANDHSIWSICAWHKNQNDMQVGTKGDEVGWNAYRACMNGGGIVSTGHEHSYARTLTLTNLGTPSAAHGATGLFDQVEVGTGKTFVFVTGLAGVGVRPFDSGSHSDDLWWASYATSDRWLRNGALQSGVAGYGALFVKFNVAGDPRRADAYFKDVGGRILDSFTIRAPL